VQDEGAGFPPGFAARAFDRFSRADEARPRSGSGLGLAIVRTIAVAHGGSAAVSEDGAPDAWISLPAATGRPARHRPESSVATSPDAASWPA
jgi:signal transduction histidine kinase